MTARGIHTALSAVDRNDRFQFRFDYLHFLFVEVTGMLVQLLAGLCISSFLFVSELYFFFFSIFFSSLFNLGPSVFSRYFFFSSLFTLNDVSEKLARLHLHGLFICCFSLTSGIAQGVLNKSISVLLPPVQNPPFDMNFSGTPLSRS